MKHHWPAYYLFIVCLALPGLLHASGFEIRSVETHLIDNQYLLNTRTELSLSDEAQKALQSGIPLIIKIDVQVEQLRSHWWNRTLNEIQLSHLLLYHALSEKYVVNDLNNGTQQDYTSLAASLAAIGQIHELPIVEAQTLEQGALYQVRIRAHLDIESLPAPMRPLAYISSEWQLASDWYTWPLQP